MTPRLQRAKLYLHINAHKTLGRYRARDMAGAGHADPWYVAPARAVCSASIACSCDMPALFNTQDAVRSPFCLSIVWRISLHLDAVDILSE
jgi:hypothetical protein